jgi:hypothetical protein
LGGGRRRLGIYLITVSRNSFEYLAVNLPADLNSLLVMTVWRLVKEDVEKIVLIWNFVKIWRGQIQD